MKAVMNEKCEKCGKEGLLTQVDEVFHFPCRCHSKNHVIKHYLCDACKDTFHVSPNKRLDVIVRDNDIGKLCAALLQALDALLSSLTSVLPSHLLRLLFFLLDL